jgi:hypothetical protein
MLQLSSPVSCWVSLISLLLLIVVLQSSSPRASVSAFNSSPVSLQEELGCSPTLSKIFQREDNLYYFDPLGLATDQNFSRYREAELKHGRVAMIAFVWSWVSTTNSISSSSSSSSNNGDTGKILLDVLRQKELPSLFELSHAWASTTDIYKFIAICGILETVVLVQVNPQDMPGDYGLAYFGVRDKGRNEQSLISELENGRLAMLVMLYYFIHDVALNHTDAYLGILKGFHIF